MSKRDKMRIELTGYDVVEKIVKAGTNTSGRVYVPKSWIGRRVKVILIDEPGDEMEDERVRRIVYGNEEYDRDEGFRKMI